MQYPAISARSSFGRRRIGVEERAANGNMSSADGCSRLPQVDKCGALVDSARRFGFGRMRDIAGCLPCCTATDGDGRGGIKRKRISGTKTD